MFDLERDSAIDASITTHGVRHPELQNVAIPCFILMFMAVAAVSISIFVMMVSVSPAVYAFIRHI